MPQFRKYILFWYNGRTDRRTFPIIESPKYMLTDVSDETLEPPETWDTSEWRTDGKYSRTNWRKVRKPLVNCVTNPFQAKVLWFSYELFWLKLSTVLWYQYETPYWQAKISLCVDRQLSWDSSYPLAWCCWVKEGLNLFSLVQTPETAAGLSLTVTLPTQQRHWT